MGSKNKISRALAIIKEGYNLRDRLVLLLYFILWPIRIILIPNMKLAYEVTIKNENGVFFCERDFSIVLGSQSGSEKELRSFFLKSKGGIFIDVGANIGKYTVLLGRGSKEKVISIEPESRNFSLLKKNVKINKLTNVIPLNLACFSEEGEKKFFLDNHAWMHSGMHSLYQNPFTSKDYVLVKTKKLDDVILNNLNKEESKRISLIKIDVEGAELDVLKGAKSILEKVGPPLIIETWNDASLKGIETFLSKYKYKCKKINEENYFFEK